jgi:superfamily II DNA or RNA helicase
MAFAVGSLVRARGREWVVLPESENEMLVLRPLGGSEDEVTGIYLPLENVEPAEFDLPDPQQAGDHRSGKMLRDAIRLGFRSSAGPFRSFGRIAIEPRPYQLVPLLVGLKLDPVRLLIADDVGIGKTIESCLVARELLDRGEIRRIAVLCPPQLAEQWQSEMRDKFHIDAELVLPGTATRLERNCSLGESLFDLYPHVIVSTDFIKSDRRRNDFLRTCPELVIVDEAHTCAYDAEARTSKHQRHELLKGLAANTERHLLLVTATPHSGNEGAFRSLLRLLNPEFADLPEDLTGKENEHHRRALAAHLIQRRRGDIKHYLDSDTPFPEREEAEHTYNLSSDYKRLFERALRYAQETVREDDGKLHHKRVRWWSALALLRSLASSPAAAAATLRTRAASADTETSDEADEVGARAVLDLMDDESAEGVDTAPGADAGLEEGEEQKAHRRLLDMAREAEALKGAKDEKLKKAAALIAELIKDGYNPIIFCRFIPTAGYVADYLRSKLPRGVEVASITSELPPDEREDRIAQLGEFERRVLVCTDCLSEGINLQQHFNAVFHYDLSWNPTRHEQREGRVDRFGQPNKNIRALTYYGIDNQIDGIVLDVLLRKHKKIRSSLGISVPLPVDTSQIVEAIFEGLLLRGQTGGASADQLMLFDDLFAPKKEDLHRKWDAVYDREKRSRTMFAQETIKVDEVAKELHAARAVVGSGVVVSEFVSQALRAHKAAVNQNGSLKADLKESPKVLKEMLGGIEKFEAVFEYPPTNGQVYLSRTSPIVEGLATYVMDTALDPIEDSVARRCGVIRTDQVERRTTILLLRLRYHIITRTSKGEHPLLAEDSSLLAFAGSPQKAEWLNGNLAEELLRATPSGNLTPDQIQHFLRLVLDSFSPLRPRLEEMAKARGEELLEAHARVRQAARMKDVSYRVEPQLPPDVLGIYVYLPKQ